MNRRKFLTLVGGGVVLSASAGAAAFALTRTPSKALAPWHAAGSAYTEPRMRALSYAILAPNPHNRQPWLVDLSEPGAITLYADTDRLLPETDPNNRQITVGLGCFLELLVMAGAEDGYRVEVDPFPLGANPEKLDKAPIARMKFAQDPAVRRDPLFVNVLKRRSLKEPYDLEKPVADTILAELRAVVRQGVGTGATNQPDKVAALRTLTHEAMAIEIDTPRTYQESVDLFRIGKAEVEANPDGIDFTGTMFEAMRITGLFTRETAVDKNAPAYQGGIDAVMANCDTAMAYVWLVTETNSRIAQLNAGRDWLRVNLAATRAGVGIQPMSQALQEYPEMRDHYQRCHRLLDAKDGTVQMLGRLGFAPAVPPSPRWPLEAKIMKV